MAEVEGLQELEEIGRGGFGVVYRAIETDLGRTVAVKVLQPLQDEASRVRFDRERRALGSLSGHPHIVTIHRSGHTAEAEPFLVMEFCERGSIGDRIDSTKGLGWQSATDITIKIAGALHTAHQAGIVHRDIKPANILVSNLGEPKLADFGIARMDGAPETQSSSITASLAHAAPEVLDGHRPDARSDVYSLASTLFELLTGSAPFVRSTDDSILPILTRIARDPMPAIEPWLAPAPVVAVLSAALAKSPTARPQTAADFGHRLAEAQRQCGLRPTTMSIEELDHPVDHNLTTKVGTGPAHAAYNHTDSNRTPSAESWSQPSPGPPTDSPVPKSWAPAVGPSNAGLEEDGGWSSAGAPLDPASSQRRWYLIGLVAIGLVIATSAVGAIAFARTNPDLTSVPTFPGAGAPADGAETPSTSSPPTDGAVGSPLLLASLLPRSGDLAFLGEGPEVSVEMAVDDINAAGGVSGHPVALTALDAKTGDIGHVRSEAEALADDSVGVVIGPMTSANSTALIDDPSADGLILISPSATSAALSELDTAGNFFQTSPDNRNLSNVAAEVFANDGVGRLAIVFIDDDYGRGLSETMQQRFAQRGGVVAATIALGDDLEAVVDELATARPDGIVIIAFGQTQPLLVTLKGRGIGPAEDGTGLYGLDATALEIASTPAEMDAFDGFRGIVARVDPRPLALFNERLAQRGIDGDGLSYTAESYDATIIAALAAEITGETTGPDLAAAIPGVTKDGEKCFDFAACKRLIADGVDIDYDGLAGPLELTEEGEPRVSSFVVVTFDGGERANPGLDDYVFSQ